MSSFIPRDINEDDDEEEDDDNLPVLKKSFSLDCLSQPYDNQNEEIDDEDEEDSDAEFLVYPCLRSIIKSKSAYAVPRNQRPETMKTSKTSFEISLANMIRSTTKSITEDHELSVADLLPSLDEKWPDPDEKEDDKKKSSRKSSMRMMRYSPSISEHDEYDDQESELNTSTLSDEMSQGENEKRCWSSPPNFLVDPYFLDEYSQIRQQQQDERPYCWSSPDVFELHDMQPLHEKIPAKYEQSSRNPVVQDLLDAHYSTSYPVIETPEHDPSVCSYRLPSSLGSAPSPSPPRPLSPVFGQPPSSLYRIPLSQSMHIPNRPNMDDYLSDVNDYRVPKFSIGSSLEDEEVDEREDEEEEDGDDLEEDDEDDDSCLRTKDEKVWPEIGEARWCWTTSSNVCRVQRSATFQQAPSEPSRPPTLSLTRSAHCQLYHLANGDSSTSDDSSDEHHAPQHLIDSAHSQLDESERHALATRQAWMERGSIVSLRLYSNDQQNNQHYLHPEVYSGVHANGVQSQYGSYSSLAGCNESTPSMKRSFTTDEFRRTRRRLPRRPDELSAPVSVIPQSKSMYDENSMEAGDKPVIIHENVTDSNRVRPPSLAIQSTVDILIQNNRGMDGARNVGVDPCSAASHLETPISPHVILPSPGSSSGGRRLPPLPVNSAVLLRRLPQNMSLPSAPKNQDHTLCFFDGMADSMMDRSCMEDSYYEEDGINGNRRKRGSNRKSFFSPDDSSGVSSCTTSDSMTPTHRVQSAFHPRHSDEVLLEIGDAVHVDRIADDHWAYGTNLRTGMAGIFPISVCCEIDIVDEICMGALPTNTAQTNINNDRDTFYLTMLASIEVAHHKGNDVLVQAMNKVLAMYKNADEIIAPQTVLMEVSFRGIHVIDKRRKNFFQCPMFDFFYSLQNISFCGAHPKQLKYFGFITKHPLLPRFACHVFMSKNSTQPIVEAIGRAFKRSYDEYMAFAHPTEDIYLE